MDNFKKCSKCGEVKLLDCFSLNKACIDGRQYTCKKCATAIHKKYNAEKHEKIKAKAAKWRAEKTKNKEKKKARLDKWRAENPEKVRTNLAKYVKNLPDAYIKNQLKQVSGVPYEHITQELIETKRLHILIKRKLKDLTK